jgi:fructose-bisphosphate aldolase class I
VFKTSVPEIVPGIVFLSGGLSPEAATVNLDAINKLGRQPWQLSFSYGRALQGEALEIWSGKEKNIIQAQKAFYQRAEKVARARNGDL